MIWQREVNDQHAFLDEALEKRRKDHRLRSLVSLKPDQDAVIVYKGERRFLNFSSNDYLGLAKHPAIKKGAEAFLNKYGAGSTASRLISGTFDIHTQLENDIAQTFDREAALIFNSGFQANSSILGTVTDRHSLILADKLSHNSLLQGSLASRADFQRFEHNDTDHLESLLENAKGEKYNRIWIVTETIFSMDGDRSPLKEIADLAADFEALLFVDDAHAVGVWGDKGLGLAKNIPEVDILLGTCGKAFGSFGAYVICSQKIREYLINFCPAFIYTTALPPAVIGATHAALNVIPELEEEREAFHQRIESFRNSLQKLGFDTGSSATQIIPLIIGDEQETLSFSNYLEENGILATAIRPPTVPEKSSRIRISLTAAHSKTQIDTFLNVLRSWKHA